MANSRILVILFLLVAPVALGCAATPVQAPRTAFSPDPAVSDPGVHAHHAQHAHHTQHGETPGVVQAHPDAPTSFAQYPEVGMEFTCPVSGGLFEVESHTRVSHYVGRYYAFCCGGCQQDFDTDPKPFVEALQSAQD